MVKTYSYSKNASDYVSEHFQVGEFASICGRELYSDEVKIDTDLVNILERLYTKLDANAIVITSGYRTKAHDKAVGGTGRGYHTTGQAADINVWHKVDGKSERYHGSDICCALQELGWHHGIGWIAGCAVHVDTRKKQYWFDEQNKCKSIGDDWFSYFESKGYHVDKHNLGDVDGDGKVTSTDARLILQYYSGKISGDGLDLSVADIDGDGKITSTDARLVLQRYVNGSGGDEVAD